MRHARRRLYYANRLIPLLPFFKRVHLGIISSTLTKPLRERNHGNWVFIEKRRVRRAKNSPFFKPGPSTDGSASPDDASPARTDGGLIRTFRVVSVPILSAAIWNRFILSASQCWRCSRSCWRLFFSTFLVSGSGHGSQMRR